MFPIPINYFSYTKHRIIKIRFEIEFTCMLNIFVFLKYSKEVLCNIGTILQQTNYKLFNNDIFYK